MHSCEYFSIIKIQHDNNNNNNNNNNKHKHICSKAPQGRNFKGAGATLIAIHC